MSRIIVDIKTASNSCIMRTEDGKVITLSVGDTYHIGNQMRPYMVVKRKDGLWLEKYGDHGNIIEEERIPRYGKYLLATSSGAARNGVFHRYYIPKDPLARFVKCDLKLPTKIIVGAENVAGTYYIGGDHFVICDGDADDYKYNCIVKNGSYVICFEEVESFNGNKEITIEKIVVAPGFDPDKVIDAIKTWINVKF